MAIRKDNVICFDENHSNYAYSYSEESNANSKDGVKERLADGGYEITTITKEETISENVDALELTMGAHEIDLSSEMAETMKEYSDETKAAVIQELLEQIENETDLERAKMLTEYATAMFGITVETFDKTDDSNGTVSLHK